MKIVTAAILEQDGKILIVRRGPGQKLCGHWEFPGGKVEPGETEEECLKRELEEELRISVQVEQFQTESHYRYEHGEFLIRAYSVRLLTGDIHLTVHDELAWVVADKLENYDLAPADIPIARSLVSTY